jgi:hypothetical protein
MRRLAAGLLLASIWGVTLPARQRDRSLERISLALQQPSPIVNGMAPREASPRPVKLGIVTLVPPTGRGEIVRVSLPIGELVTRAFKGVAAANRHRQEAAARREVEAALKALDARSRNAVASVP